MPCSLNQKIHYICFHFNTRTSPYRRTSKYGKIMEWRQSGGVEGKEPQEETKEKKGVSGHDGRVTHPVQEHSGSRLSINPPPFLKTHTHTHTHCCSSQSKSRCTWRNPSNPKQHRIPNALVCVCIFESEGKAKKEPRCFLALASLSLFFSLLAWWGV